MFANLPPVTRALLVANVLAFGLQAMAGELAMLDFMLWPLGRFGLGMAGGLPVTAGFEPWQLVSYGFLHGSMLHLFFNMFGLWMFGSELERLWGRQRYWQFLLASLLAAALTQLAITWISGSNAPTVGASGALFGLLLAFGMLFPNRTIMPLFPPIPMKARTFVILFGVGALFLGMTGLQPGVAHFAHLGGMITGWLLIRHWRNGGGRRGGGSGGSGGGKRDHLRVIK